MVDGLVPYDFFCEDNPAINLFVFTGSATPGKAVEEQTLWGFTRLERFEAMTGTSDGEQKATTAGFKVSASSPDPARTVRRAVKFQRVLKIIKHAGALGHGDKNGLRNPDG